MQLQAAGTDIILSINIPAPLDMDVGSTRFAIEHIAYKHLDRGRRMLEPGILFQMCVLIPCFLALVE